MSGWYTVLDRRTQDVATTSDQTVGARLWLLLDAGLLYQAISLVDQLDRLVHSVTLKGRVHLDGLDLALRKHHLAAIPIVRVDQVVTQLRIRQVLSY